MAARAAELGVSEVEAAVGQVFEETVEYHHAPTFPLDEDGQGDAHLALTIAAHRAVVDVDPDLGLVRLVDLATSQEVGRILNPTQLLGQLEGGAAQGVGLALMEEIVVVDGLVRNPSFTDYLIPTALDLPDLHDRRHHRGGRTRRAVRGQGRGRGADHLVGPGRGRRHPGRHRPRPRPRPGEARRHRSGRSTMSAPATTSLRIDRSRLLARIDELAQIGALAVDGHEGGSSRLALTDADGAGRDLVTSWMADLGLRVDIDGVGNVVGTWPADRFDPPVMTGSHIDTVATGGRYDGNLGVLAGLEVVETADRGIDRR